MAQRCGAVSTEFENVPAQALATRWLPPGPCPPGAVHAVAVCQDRALEKAHFAKSGVPCAPHAVLSSTGRRGRRARCMLLPGILKTATMGYDGKGQRRVRSRDELRAAFAELGGVRCVLEALLPLAAECSASSWPAAATAPWCTLPAHSATGTWVASWPPRWCPPLGIDPALVAQAEASARAIAEAFGYVGVLCTEFFVLTDGRLLANEMAPRPHNSGHYSIDSCTCPSLSCKCAAMAGLPWAPRACTARP